MANNNEISFTDDKTESQLTPVQSKKSDTDEMLTRLYNMINARLDLSLIHI